MLSAARLEVEEVGDLDALAGADLAIVVNPNNPDGRRHDREQLLALLPRVGRLVIDESFADAVPELSLASEAGRPGLLDPALVRKVLWACRPAAWVCARR